MRDLKIEVIGAPCEYGIEPPRSISHGVNYHIKDISHNIKVRSVVFKLVMAHLQEGNNREIDKVFCGDSNDQT